MTSLSIAKAHAYGNDFLLVPEAEAEALDLRALARSTCARHSGLGADGLIIYTLPSHDLEQPARMRLLNADGSDSELSGNGLRCLAALVRRRLTATQNASREEVRVETDAGLKTLSWLGRSQGRDLFRAAMGPPSQLRREVIDVDGEPIDVVTMHVGNPQCVALVEELPDRARFSRLGPALATHARFAAGSNVEFVRVDAPTRLQILIWERGVGPTEASGTGACASAVAAIVYGGASRDLEVVSPGGSQRVEWDGHGLHLTGWAEVIFEGHWLPAVSAAVASAGDLGS